VCNEPPQFDALCGPYSVADLVFLIIGTHSSESRCEAVGTKLEQCSCRCSTRGTDRVWHDRGTGSAPRISVGAPYMLVDKLTVEVKQAVRDGPAASTVVL
jgi:hypothetical protein